MISSSDIAAREPGSFRKVLIVDDEPRVTEALGRSLRKEFDVKVANDGRTAFRTLLVNDDIDTMILDVTMPYYDSVELIFDLGKAKRFPKLVFISGWCPSTLKLVAAMAAHLDFEVLGHFEKPVSAAALVEALKPAVPDTAVSVPTTL